MVRRVVFFDSVYPPPIKGGKEKQAHNLAKSLKDVGINVIVLTSHKMSNSLVDRYEGILRLFLPTILLPLGLILLRPYSNIIHVHTPSRIGRLMITFAKILGYKTVFKIPNINLVGTSKKHDKSIINNSNAIITLENESFNCIKNLIKNSNYKKSTVYLISNMVKENNYSYNRSDSEYILTYCSRLIQQKRPLDFLDLIIRLKNNKFKIKVNILGDGPLFFEMVNYAKVHGIYNICQFHGMVEDSISFIKDSEIVISTSSKEGMSNTILESMSCGIPVVASDVGASSYLLGSYAEKFIFQVSDINKLFDSVKLILDDSELSLSYSSYLYNRSRKLFAPDIISKKYKSLYSSI